MHVLPLLYLFTHLVLSVHCLQNVTIDDNDSSIQYIGQWDKSTPINLDYGGSHAYTTNPTSQALLNFTGVAIYFMSPLWPYAVSTALTLDSLPTNIVDLTDHNSNLTAGGGPETVESAVVWSVENLPNTTHTLRISVGRGQQNAIVDGLIYTVLAPGESLDSGSSGGSDDGHQVIIIVLAVLVGVFGLLLLGLLLWLCLRRREPTSSRTRRTSTGQSSNWGGDAKNDVPVAGRNSSGSPRSSPLPAPHTPPPPSQPDSDYRPNETAWSTSSVGGPGIQNMTGVGVSTRSSHVNSYHQGDHRHSASHFGASQGDLADAYDPGPYTNSSRNLNYPNI